MLYHPEGLTCLWQVKDGMNGAKRFAVFSVPATIAGWAHISLVFREMWDTTGLSLNRCLR